MLNALPLIITSLTGSLRDLRSGKQQEAGGVPRTERDLPMWVVTLGSLALVLAVAASYLIPTDLPGRLLGGVMVVLFGFLFVTVSSRITGVIGSSSNPISGMTIATLLLVCLIFSPARLGRARIPLDGALDRRRGLYRVVQRRNDLARLEDRFLGRRHALEATNRHFDWSLDLGTGHGLDVARHEHDIHHKAH